MDNPPVRVDPPTLTPVVIPDWNDNGGPLLYGVPLGGKNVYGLDSYMIDLTKRTTPTNETTPAQPSQVPRMTWYDVKRQERIEALTTQQARPSPVVVHRTAITQEQAPVGVQAFTACFLVVCGVVVVWERIKRKERVKR